MKLSYRNNLKNIIEKDLKTNMKHYRFTKKIFKTINFKIINGFFVLLLLTSLPQDTFSQPKTLIGNDISAKQLIPIPIEDFEKPKEWKAIPTPYDPNRINSFVDIRYVDGRPADLGDLPARKIFGIKFQFRYPGYNFITIFPPPLKDVHGKPLLDDTTLEEIGPGLIMPGRTKKISIWVLSQGKDYTLEGYIRDWKGNTHRLKFGSLKFVGWRPMITSIPVGVPQAIGSYPQTKTLKLIKFIVRSTRTTSTEPVYLFFDQIKILTNKFDVHFDGAEIDTNWGGALAPVKGLLQATKPAFK